MNTFILTLIFASVSLSVAAQIFLKHGMSKPNIQSALNTDISSSIIAILTSIPVLTGLFAYVASAGIWLIVLSKIEVSKAYPFVGLGFIGTMVFAYLFLGEPLTTNKVIATLLIFFGVVLISR